MAEQRAPRLDPVTRWGLLLGASVGLAATIPLWIADIRLHGASAFPLAYVALPLLALLPLFGRIGRPVAGLRSYAASALVLAALSPALVYAATAVIKEPFFWCDRLDGAPDPVNRFLPALLLGPMLAAPILVRLVAAGSPRIDRAVGLAAGLATTLAACLVLAAWTRSAEHVGDALHAGWILTAAIGLGVALVALASSLRGAARSRQIAAGRAGTRSESGWIRFEDGLASMRAPRGEALPGPVIVLASERRRGSVYRSEEVADATVVLEGTRASCLAAARAEGLIAQSFALAVALLSSAPLLGAALEGLFF